MDEPTRPSESELTDDIETPEQIYSPLSSPGWKQLSGNIYTPAPERPIRLPDEPDSQNRDQIIAGEDVREQLSKDQGIKIILGNTRKKGANKEDKNILEQSLSTQAASQVQEYSWLNFENSEDQTYSFCNLSNPYVIFHETPVFHRCLTTHFAKFNRQNYQTIKFLFEKTDKSQREQASQQLNPRQNIDPTKFISNPQQYFNGIGNYLAKNGFILQAMFIYKLGIYVDPYCPRSWMKLMDIYANMGNYHEAMILAKALFLFKPHPVVADYYLKYASKAEVPMYEIRGMLASVKNVFKWQKVLLSSAKLQMKNRKFCRGLTLLNQYCHLVDFKPNFADGVILLIRQLQNKSQRYLIENMLLLKKMILKECPKYEIYSMYIEYLRELAPCQDYLSQYYPNYKNPQQFLKQQISSIWKKINEKLSKETIYKVLLEIAEVYYLSNFPTRMRQVRNYLQLAFKASLRNKDKVGVNRAKRNVYLAALSMSKAAPVQKGGDQHLEDDHIKFMRNKKRYIQGKKLVKYDFKQWKYYMHYALGGDVRFLKTICHKWPQYGRLVAQWVHLLRIKHSPIVMLKLWRDKIDQVPKSGELWCEGGRIYADLKQFTNALKCFEFALHFTPQYGDTFFQILRILLESSRLYQAQQLKKKFYLSEPFVGNTFSFLKNERKQEEASQIGKQPRILLVKRPFWKIWQIADYEIRNHLYSGIHNKSKRLTAIESYNQAILSPNSPSIRQHLFCSYEQLENPKN